MAIGVPARPAVADRPQLVDSLHAALVAGLVAAVFEAFLLLAIPGVDPLTVVYPFIAGVYLIAGTVAWGRRPASRMGVLIMWGGLSLLLSGLEFTGLPVLGLFGKLISTWILAVIVHLLLAFPTGRLHAGPTRVIVALAYLNSVVLQLPARLLAPEAAGFWGWVQSGVGVAVMLGLTLVLLERLRLASPAVRRTLVPLYGFGWRAATARLWIGRPARPGRGSRRSPARNQCGRRGHQDSGGAAMRVVIAEDEALLAQGLTLALDEGGLDVVSMVGNAEDLLAKVAELAPDLVITDIRMPPGYTDEGIRAALRIRREHPNTPVVVLSQHVQRRYAVELLAADAAGIGYPLKQRVADIPTFLDDLKRVAAGGTALDPEVVALMLHRADKASGQVRNLTKRQREVLALMAEGRSNGWIAEHLYLTEKAVVQHTSRIYNSMALPVTPDDHRRVMAVVRYLEGTVR